MLNNYKKIISLLTLKEKTLYKFLIILILIGGIIEILSLTLAYQIIRIFSLGNEFLQDSFTNIIKNFYEINNFNDILLISSFLLLIIFLIKLVYLLFQNFYQNKFIFNLQSNLISRLYNMYLNQDYSYHLKSSSPRMIRNLKDEISLFCVGVVQPLISIILEVFLILLIFILILYIEPIIVISSISFLIFLSVIYFFIIKQKLSNFGLERQNLTERILKIIQEGINGIRDIKIFSKEIFFVDFLKQRTNRMATVSTYLITLQQFPRIALEFLIILVFVSLVLITDINEKNYSNTIKTIGLFAIASFRMLPSINKILMSLQNIRTHFPAVNVLNQELNLEKVTEYNQIYENDVKFNNTIELKNINFKYSPERKFEFQNFNLTINKNQMIGLIGISGSGKSTLVDLLVGLLKPDDGEVKVDNESIKSNLRSWRSKIGYVSQSTYLMDESLENNIAYNLNSDAIDSKRINEVIELAELNELVTNLPNSTKTIVGERGSQLSGGQIQRIGIARALYRNPDILILDEATSSLDINTESKIINTIKKFKGKKTIIIISHRQSSVVHCDKIYEIKNGKLIY